MPDPADYDDQSSWMSDCVPEMMGEGREQDQAVAACLNIWRNRAARPGKLKAERWTAGGSRDLPLAETERAWDGAAARDHIFERAHIGTDNGTPNVTMARRGFLIYDAANPELRGSYSLPFADFVDGTLKAIPSGLRAAASRLPQVTDVSAGVKERARRILDGYFSKMEENDKRLSAMKQKQAAPSVNEDETHDEYIERCVEALTDDGTSEEDANSICALAWENRSARGSRQKQIMKRKRVGKQDYDGYDVPSVNEGESHTEFIDRCIASVTDDGASDEEAHSLCALAWENRSGSGRMRHKTHTEIVHGMEFVLSDETPDRMGDIINSGGWELTNFKKNPIALFNHRPDFPIGIWENLRSENGALRGNLKLAPVGTSERIDEVRKLIEADILKAVSVGFHPIASKPRMIGEKRLGEHFIKQELVETSLVSVPANPNALAVAKSLDISTDTLDMVFAEHGQRKSFKAGSVSSGKHAVVVRQGQEDKMSLSQRIQDTQSRINELRDRLTDHLAEVDDSNVSDAQLQLTTDLNDQIQREQKQLSALMQAERNVMGSTALTKQNGGNGEYVVPEPEGEETNEEFMDRCESVVADQGADGEEATRLCALSWENHHHGNHLESGRGRRRKSLVTRNGGRVMKPYIAPSGRQAPAIPRTRAERLEIVVRAGVVSFMAHLKKWSFELARENIAKEYPRYADRNTKAFCDYVSKAESAPAMTTVTGWAEELVQQIHGDYLELLYPNAIAPQLFPRGLSLTFGRAGRISIPTRSRTPSISGSFVGEGMPIPVRQAAFTAQILTPKKMAVITTWTREMDEASIPAIEGLLRNAIQEDTAVTLDSTLLDDNDADAVRPAGLLSTTALPNGAGAITVPASTAATGFERVVADLQALTGALLAGTQGNIRDLVLVMNPMQSLAVSMTAMPGVSAFPFMADIAGDQLLGYPIIKSGTVPAGTVVAIDAADFVVVGGEAPRFEVSDQATLHMEDTNPAQITNGGTATPVRSLWQTDSLGLRLILPINWCMRRPGMVAYIEGVTW